MDPALLASTLVGVLAPMIPQLLGAGRDAAKLLGSEAAKAAGKKVGDAAPGGVMALWSLLRPAVASTPAAQEAVQDVAAAPDNGRAREALAWQLEKMLRADSALAARVAEQLQLTERAGNQAIAVDHAVAINGPVEGSPINIGDNNRSRVDWRG